jgi:hypothetical protein
MKFRKMLPLILAGCCALCMVVFNHAQQQTPIAYDTQGHALYAPADCVSKTAPAVCGSASTGLVVVAAGATTVTVNTTAMKAGTHPVVQEDASLGALLAVTCNTTAATAPPVISARVNGTSFTITTTAPTTNPRCFSFQIFN